MPSEIDQYVQTHRSQGRAGPMTDYENIIFGTFEKVKKETHGTDLFPPGLWFSNGWVEGIKWLKPQTKAVTLQPLSDEELLEKVYACKKTMPGDADIGSLYFSGYRAAEARLLAGKGEE